MIASQRFHLEEKAPLSPTAAERRKRRSAAVLLDQQMWCWGQDIERKDGNLLLQFGFRKVRPPEKVSGCTAYLVTPFPGCQLVLWGFGLFFGLQSSGGIFIRRYGFNPGWSCLPEVPVNVWCPERLPTFKRPQSDEEREHTQRLTSKAAIWLAGYEQWVLDTVGVAYRQNCLRLWRKKALVSEEAMPTAWRQLAEIQFST